MHRYEKVMYRAQIDKIVVYTLGVLTNLEIAIIIIQILIAWNLK